MIRNPIYSDEEIIEQIQMLAKELDRTPTTVEFDADKRTTTSSTVIRRFGSWNTFVKMAGLRVTTHYNITRDELIQQLQDLSKRLGGKTPAQLDFEEDPDTASRATVVNVFGTWNNFVEAAGFKSRQSTKEKKKNKP